MQENDRKSFKQQLEELPPEFTLFMEEYREDHFKDLIKLVTNEFDLLKEFEQMTTEEQNKVIEIFKVFHNFGFYGGVSYTLDPQQRYVSKFIEDRA